MLLANFERQLHCRRCQPPVHALKQIDFKRLANIVACQIFDRGWNQHLIGA